MGSLEVYRCIRSAFMEFVFLIRKTEVVSKKEIRRFFTRGDLFAK